MKMAELLPLKYIHSSKCVQVFRLYLYYDYRALSVETTDRSYYSAKSYVTFEILHTHVLKLNKYAAVNFLSVYYIFR